MPGDPERGGDLEPFHLKVAGTAVHTFTALGSVCGFLALQAALARNFEAAFGWLGLALFIDGIDGTFARAVDVTRRLPRFSGDRLDLIVDYVTYVFVPTVMLQLAGFLTGAWGGVLAALILLSSLFHFSDLASKTTDHCFVGFPAIWNIVAFYVFAFAMPPWGVTVLVLTCVILTFIPMAWVHPLRVLPLRMLTLGLVAAWSYAAVSVLGSGLPATGLTFMVLLVVALYVGALAVLWPLLRARFGGTG